MSANYGGTEILEPLKRKYFVSRTKYFVYRTVSRNGIVYTIFKDFTSPNNFRYAFAIFRNQYDCSYITIRKFVSAYQRVEVSFTVYHRTQFKKAGCAVVFPVPSLMTVQKYSRVYQIGLRSGIFSFSPMDQWQILIK